MNRMHYINDYIN